MIEHIHTAITFFAVEGIFADTSLAYMTEVFEILYIEICFVFNGLPMQYLGVVCGVYFRCDNPKYDDDEEQNHLGHR